MLVDWVGLYVLVGFARQFNPLALPKAGYRIGLTSLLLLAGAGSVHDATALNETRTLSFHHTHSDEDLTVTFKRDGRYDEEALKKINHFLRDWPRMTCVRLARVFPDGRTVHLPANGGPMKGYELARADIERRGNGDDAASVGKKPSLFAALFRGGKSTEEDDEGASAPAKNEKPAPTSVTAAAAPAKSADPVPTPRAKPQVAA